MRSLLGRLGAGLGVGLVILVTLQWWVVNTALRSLTEAYVVSRLEHDADSLLAGLAFGPGGELVADPRSNDAIYHIPFSGHYYLIESAAGQLRSRSLWDQPFPPVADAREPQYLPGPQGQRLLVIARDFSKQGRALRIAVAEDMTPSLAQLERFAWQYALVSLALMVVVMTLLSWVARRSLRPLAWVVDDVGRLERGEISRLRETVPAEVHPLVTEFNRLLEVMQQRLERSRTALGNLAHALKTPLTVLVRLEEDAALQQHAELRQRLRQQTGDMRAIIERQLKRARLDRKSVV